MEVAKTEKKVKITTTISENHKQGVIRSLCVVGKEVWSGATNTICIWDCITSTLKKEIQAHKGTINCLKKVTKGTSDNDYLGNLRNTRVWSASWDGTIKIWDIREHNDYCCLNVCYQDIGKSTPFMSIEVASDRVWTGTQHFIYIWDLEGNKLGKVEIEQDVTISCMAFSGMHMWCGIDKNLCIFPTVINPTKSPKSLRQLRASIDKVQCLLHLGEFIWSGDILGDIHIWSCETFDLVTTIKGAHSGPIFCMIKCKPMSKDYEVWTSGKDKFIRIWDSENFICMKALQQHDDYIYIMAAVSHEQVWTGSHSLCIWNEDRNLAHNIRLITYKNEDKYVGEVLVVDINNDEVQRHGRGEMHLASGEIYVGNWQNDERSGYGIATYSNKDKYYGNWLNNMKFGHGVYIYHDGTCFEGCWKNDKKKGPGCMLLPNGDKIDGEWKGDQINKATYTKGNTSKLPKCTQELFHAKSEGALVEARDKPTRIIPFHKWTHFSVANIKEIEKKLKEKFPSMKITIKDLSILLNDESHPLGKGLSDFSYMFNASYHYSYGDERTLLFNAIDDVQSFIKGMELTIATLIPSVKPRDCVNMISNIVFSKIYNSLFSLYKEVNKSKDSLLQVKIHSLSGITLQAIGVRDKFCLSKMEKEELPYTSVINKLRQLSELKTISKKVRCLIEASKAILRSVDEYYRPHLRMDRINGDSSDESEDLQDVQEEGLTGDDLAMGAGDKFPILLFCLLKSNIPNLHSEISFMKEFADPTIFREESQYRLVEFEQAVAYIQTLDWNVYDEEGVLLSVSFLEKKLLESVRTGRNIFQNTVKEFPRMIWFAEILLLCGTIREKDKHLPFTLSKDYNRYLKDGYYFKLANQVFGAVGLDIKKDEKTQNYEITFKSAYPQYIYTKLASLLEEEIQHMD